MRGLVLVVETRVTEETVEAGGGQAHRAVEARLHTIDPGRSTGLVLAELRDVRRIPAGLDGRHRDRDGCQRFGHGIRLRLRWRGLGDRNGQRHTHYKRNERTRENFRTLDSRHCLVTNRLQHVPLRCLRKGRNLPRFTILGRGGQNRGEP